MKAMISDSPHTILMVSKPCSFKASLKRLRTGSMGFLFISVVARDMHGVFDDKTFSVHKLIL